MAVKYQLKNGLTVLLVESHKSPVVSVQMWVKTGSADELKGEEGISHFIEHLVFKGTEKYQVGQIAQQVEGAGGELNAYTSFDQTVFHVTISKQFVDTGLDVISQMMGFPAFIESEIDNEREVVLEEIKRSNDSPHRQVSRMLFSTIYKKHPYGLPVIGKESVIKTVSRKTMVNYFHRRYVPENMTLIVVGDFDNKEMKQKVKENFGSFVSYPLKKIKRIAEPKQDRPRILTKKGEFEETFLHIAWPIPKGTHQDIPALDVLAMILGQGDSSRLMRKLRIENHLTNYCTSSTYTPMDRGFFVISSSLNFDNLAATLEEIGQQLKLILTDSVNQEELQKAITNVESDQYYGMETVDGMAQIFGSYEHLFQDYKQFKDFIRNVSSITEKDLQKVAKKYLRPESLTLIVSTPKDELRAKKELTAFSKKYIEIFNSAKNSKPLKPLKVKKRRIAWKMDQFEPVETRKIKLDSGGQLVVRRVKDTPVVSLRCGFLGGMRIENASDNGVNELLSRVWPAGANGISETELHHRVESLAARLNAFSGRNTAGMYMTSLRPMAEEVFDLFSQTLSSPLLSPEIIEREKMYMLEYLKNRKDNPAQLAILAFSKVMFDGHPYSSDPHGQEDTIQNLNETRLRHHLEKMRCSKNMNLVIVGDFEIDPWVDRLNKLTSSLPKGSRQEKSFVFTGPSKPIHLFESSNKEQSHIIMGYKGLTFSDPNRYILEVLQSILSGQGGRLFIELRDKASLAYSVSPLRLDGIDAGYFGAYIGCSPEKGKKALSMMQAEFDKLCQQKVSEEEIDRAKRYLIGRHDIALQKTTSVGSSILFDDIYGLPYDETFRFTERIADVTASQIQKLAQSIFSQPSVISVVGPENPI